MGGIPAHEQATSKHAVAPQHGDHAAQCGAEPQAQAPLLHPAQAGPGCPCTSDRERSQEARTLWGRGTRVLRVLHPSGTSPLPTANCRRSHHTSSSVLPKLSLAPAVQRWGCAQTFRGFLKDKRTVQCLLTSTQNHGI